MVHDKITVKIITCVHLRWVIVYAYSLLADCVNSSAFCHAITLKGLDNHDTVQTITLIP